MRLEIVFKDGRKEIFDRVISFNVAEEQTVNERIEPVPTVGKLFEVKPMEINRSSFEKHMIDRRQENTRQIIQKAFAEVDKHPEEYDYPFYTMFPKVTWDGCRTVKELKAYARELGGLMANWVEQALEWAQRISNGESCADICNKPDNAECYRMVVWNDEKVRKIGGSYNGDNDYPASLVHKADYYYISNMFYITVPLVVFKKKYTF